MTGQIYLPQRKCYPFERAFPRIHPLYLDVLKNGVALKKNEHIRNYSCVGVKFDNIHLLLLSVHLNLPVCPSVVGFFNWSTDGVNILSNLSGRCFLKR